MFTKEELNSLRSCWILPDGTFWTVPPEEHDINLPDGYYDDNWDMNKSIDEVEQKCFRMSFSWGWTAPISQMTIPSKCKLTEHQMQIIRYLLMAKIIKYNQIENYSKDDEFYAMLDEVDKELKKSNMKESDKFVELFDKFKELLDAKDFKSVKELMESFCKDESHVGELKTILVITKSFKENEVICDTRKKIVALLESKLGQKLV